MSGKQIEMVDLQSQYFRLKDEIDKAILAVNESCAFINGPQVKEFGTHLETYLKTSHVIPCGNGTDALQIALMALGLRPGDEVLVPAFNYVAAAEAVALLGLVPVMVDVEPRTFNISPWQIEPCISRRTKAIIVAHLFGQACDMETILNIAKAYHLYVIEDNAQSLGADYIDKDGALRKAGTLGHIGTTSFFPSKPLGCYGDGGAIITADRRLAERIRMITMHGQESKYHHKVIGCNSRLDTIQAAILDVKLKYLDEFNAYRIKLAIRYNKMLASCKYLKIPQKSSFSSHIYHQYTLIIKDGKRDFFQQYLREKGVPSTVYYPLPLQDQDAFKGIAFMPTKPKVASDLCKSVLSIPIHTEMTKEVQDYIIKTVQEADQLA
ncbi:DegT/DnrJ/EryC1/StrS family aminotransferase [Parabacteroides bouchesdurhonensis]|uniref:DegT/DnrJ/EryC1/StrS family aminotransferase n=1 Tax=Parabacteroides bouchesdurhonensis TaxID=1936995 RepID=UPI000C830C34|nr:DegT/DnrJ/EryC1/StrS family aminotransferase [Parabacteroides bouchesdurhonensis]